MKKRLTCLLALLLALALPMAALAEAVPGEGFDGVYEISPAEADWVDAPVDELELELTVPEIAAPEDAAAAEGATETPAGETPATPAEGTPEPPAEPAPETPAEPAEAQPETPSYLGDPIAVKTIKVSKDLSKTVYKGIPYALSVTGGIKKVKTSASKVAKGAKDGTLTLKKAGKAKLTITNGKGKKFVLTLTVKDTPAPGSLKATYKSGKFKLSWTKAKYATGYLIQYRPAGGEWTDFKAVSKSKTSATVTDAVAGTTDFRVIAILGDALGGESATVSVLAPVTDVKVICEEEFYFGPTDHLNVTWKATVGASKYEVWRATLPSGKYKKIGTTKKTWFADTRDPEKLYAYKIKPVSGLIEGLPESEPVTLWSGMGNNVYPPKDMESDTGIILVVNKTAQVVTAYIKDADGRYRLPLRQMICSTGRTYERTRNGEYTLLSKRGEWYTYPGPSGDTIRWPSVYRSGYYFHSPLYNANHTIRGWTVKQLGSRASAGCVRLKSNDAEWVSKHCPLGTKVYICDGKEKKALREALKPADVKVKGF